MVDRVNKERYPAPLGKIPYSTLKSLPRHPSVETGGSRVLSVCEGWSDLKALRDMVRVQLQSYQGSWVTSWGTLVTLLGPATVIVHFYPPLS